jgi:hypothetical protein
MAHASELEHAIRAAGRSLIESGSDGEIDIIITGVPENHGANR